MIRSVAMVVGLCLGMFCLVTTPFAASDGTVGATSTGTAEVSLSIPELFKVGSMSDYTLGVYGGTGDLVGDSDLCVYHNGDGGYRVTVTDSNTITSNIFAVENSDSTYEIPMSVSWNDETGTTGAQSMSDGLPLSSLSGANTQTADCSSGGMSANMQVTLAEGVLQTAVPGIYTSVLTIVVEAD